MSIKVIAAVLSLEPSQVTASERAVLVSLAFHCDHAGKDAFQAVRTMARETSLTRRAVQKILPRLKAKGFVTAEGRMSRGSVRYALNLEALHRERRSQSVTTEREPRSQSSPHSPDCEPRSQGGEPRSGEGANPVRPGGEPGSPDQSLISQLDQSPIGRAPAKAPGPPISKRQEENNRRLLDLILDAAMALGPRADVDAVTQDVKRRAERSGVTYDGTTLEAAVRFKLTAIKAHRVTA